MQVSLNLGNVSLSKVQVVEASRRHQESYGEVNKEKQVSQNKAPDTPREAEECQCPQLKQDAVVTICKSCPKPITNKMPTY
jgi:hypothetical protein